MNNQYIISYEEVDINDEELQREKFSHCSSVLLKVKHVKSIDDVISVNTVILQAGEVLLEELRDSENRRFFRVYFPEKNKQQK